MQLRDYKPGSSRADLEESRAAARAQQGLEPDSDEVREGGREGEASGLAGQLWAGRGQGRERGAHRVSAGC